MEIKEVLNKIQTEIVAPKNQYNKFGDFNYRSCEDILEALKPLLKKYNSTVILTDELVLIGARYYVKATVALTAEKDQVATVAYAREPEIHKGMDSSQITGATSSYARKYALNGLFLIDDTKDADTKDNTVKTSDKPQAQSEETFIPDDRGNLDIGKIVCNDCSSPILTKDGAEDTKVIEYSKSKYNVPVCWTCQQKRKSNG